MTLDDINLETASNIPEGIGYLHEIGLNFGYGPTSMLQWTLEHLHIYTGLPWWSSIMATALVVRLCMVPLFLMSSDQMARQNALVTVTKPITDRITAAQRTQDTQAMQIAYAEMLAVRKRAGLSFKRQMTPVILTAVFGFCGFRLLRAMSTLPVPGFHDGGFLWLKDLTLTDPYLILPIAMGLSVHLLTRLGGDTGATGVSSLGPTFQKVMLYGLPLTITVVTGLQPGALCIWFVTTGTFSICQSYLLQRPAVRNLFNLAPMYKPTPKEGDPNPMAAVMESWNAMRGKPATSTPEGKNANIMRPQYQPPTSRYSGPNGTIDIKASSSKPTSVAKPTTGGVFSQAKELWDKGRDQAIAQAAELKTSSARTSSDAAAGKSSASQKSGVQRRKAGEGKKKGKR